MSTITIRKLDMEVKQRIGALAQCNGRSMEGEIRTLLRQAVGLGPTNLEKLNTKNRFDQMQNSQAEAILAALMRGAKENDK